MKVKRRDVEFGIIVTLIGACIAALSLFAYSLQQYNPQRCENRHLLFLSDCLQYQTIEVCEVNWETLKEGQSACQKK